MRHDLILVNRAASVLLLVPIVDVLPLRQHTLMKDARYHHASRLDSIENDMPTVFHPTQAGSDMIARAAQPRIRGKLVTALFKVLKIANCLLFSLCAQGIDADIHQVGLGQAGQADFSQP